jgi:hypothetical protein
MDIPAIKIPESENIKKSFLSKPSVSVLNGTSKLNQSRNCTVRARQRDGIIGIAAILLKNLYR